MIGLTAIHVFLMQTRELRLTTNAQLKIHQIDEMASLETRHKLMANKDSFIHNQYRMCSAHRVGAKVNISRTEDTKTGEDRTTVSGV